MKIHRVNVNFSPDAYKILKKVAKRKGKTIANLVRDAISFEKWLQDYEDDGWKLVLERGDEIRPILRHR